MCGDGGNDCGALRAAHAGMSLSDAEASVISPFTSKSKTCTSVVDLLKEGKAAMHTNLSSYKFLIMYGQLCPVFMVRPSRRPK
jgi:cation-transporting ATPase 13A3/4/5